LSREKHNKSSTGVFAKILFIKNGVGNWFSMFCFVWFAGSPEVAVAGGSPGTPLKARVSFVFGYFRTSLNVNLFSLREAPGIFGDEIL